VRRARHFRRGQQSSDCNRPIPDQSGMLMP
jgi:hypothetical protein